MRNEESLNANDGAGRKASHSKPAPGTAALSLYRSHLMGFAMIAVMLFHVGQNRHDTIAYCISRCGNVGVDMFLFLSGMGLWYSWTRLSHDSSFGTSLISFYKKRYIRIYPTWLAVACIFYIPIYIKGGDTLTGTILNITINWDFWELDAWQFWFIPAIMMLYTAAPFYMALISRHEEYRLLPVAAILLCILIQYWAPLHSAVGHIEIFFSRIPIFLIGINAGRWVKEDRPINRPALWLIVLIFIMSAFCCVNFENGLRGRFPLFLERMVYIPLSISMMLLLCRMFAVLPRRINTIFTFIGAISLELYMVHIHYALAYIRPWQLGYWGTAAAMFAIAVPVAWLLHKAMAMILLLPRLIHSKTNV